MNKNYKNVFMVTMFSLASYNGLMSTEQAEKICIDPERKTLEERIRELMADYIMANIALCGGTTAMSTIVTSGIGCAPLRSSLKQVAKMSWDGSKKIKTPLIAAPIAVGYHTMKKHSVQ